MVSLPEDGVHEGIIILAHNGRLLQVYGKTGDPVTPWYSAVCETHLQVVQSVLVSFHAGILPRSTRRSNLHDVFDFVESPCEATRSTGFLNFNRIPSAAAFGI